MSKDLTSDGVRHRVFLITARADALRWLGRPEEALDAYAEAAKAEQGSIADLEPAIRRGKVLAQALLAIQKGDPIRAESLARQAVELAPQDGETLYSAAAVAARCAGASPAHKLECQRHLARSVELLKRAKSNSFPTVFGPRLFLVNDPAFDGMRSHADFQEFTAGLARPAVMSSRTER
jgi:tetratricopeptide (TPR) repeat protein